jgi:hypothetical protein
MVTFRVSLCYGCASLGQVSFPVSSEIASRHRHLDAKWCPGRFGSAALPLQLEIAMDAVAIALTVWSVVAQANEQATPEFADRGRTPSDDVPLLQPSYSPSPALPVAPIQVPLPSLFAPGWAFRFPANVLLPTLETAVFNVGLNQFDRVALQASYAQVQWSTVENNFSHPALTISNDDIFINYLGHAYMGTVPFNAARSLGLNFWESLPFAEVSILAWEWTGENHVPYTNKIIESGMGGPLWGEAFHRISVLALENGEVPKPVSAVFALALDPGGTINYGFFRRPDDSIDRTLWRAELYGGALGFAPSFAAGNTQALFGVDMVYGLPDGSAGCVQPFDTFSLRADAGGGGGPLTFDESIWGLIVGCRIPSAVVPAEWGLVGLSDFATGPGFRVAAESVGPGLVLVARPFSHLRLRADALATFVVMGAAGTTLQTDNVSPPDLPNGQALYSEGPGAEGMAEVEAIIAEVISLRATGRSWWILSLTTPGGGVARVETMGLRLELRLPAHQLIIAEATYAARQPARSTESPQSGWLGFVGWGVQMGRDW